MKRKQIYLTKELNDKLKDIAYIKNKSESSLIRDALEEYIVKIEKQVENKDEENPLLKIIALGESGSDDISDNHDSYLYQRKEYNKEKEDN